VHNIHEQSQLQQATMKSYALASALLFGLALLNTVSAKHDKDYDCLSDDDAEDLIKGYVRTFQGIPRGGKLKEVEKLAMKTFAVDIEMNSQSFLWTRGYPGPV
jgi:hypothetical protein